MRQYGLGFVLTIGLTLAQGDLHHSAIASETTCEMTLETIVPARANGSDRVQWDQLSAPAQHDLVQAKIPWAMSGQVLLESRQTIPFPTVGEVRIVSLPWSWPPAVELRNREGQLPDWLTLNRSGLPVGGPPMQCGPIGFGSLAGSVSKDRFLEITIYPSGSIPKISPRPQPHSRGLGGTG